MKNTKNCKFKIGDFIVSTLNHDFQDAGFILKFNTIYKVIGLDIKDKPRININDQQGWNDCRLATPAEIRKTEGFSKELDEMINET